MNQFDLNNQWKAYLKRGGLKEEEMNPIQCQEMKRAFYGACGQMLILLRDGISPLTDKEGMNAIKNMFDQVGNFWMKEAARHN